MDALIDIGILIGLVAAPFLVNRIPHEKGEKK